MSVAAALIVQGSEGYSACWPLATIQEALRCELTMDEDVYVGTFGTIWGICLPGHFLLNLPV